MKKLIICITALLLVTACMDEPEPIEVSNVTISPEFFEIIVGETEPLIATVLPENASDNTVTWSTDNPKVAIVDNNGNVTGISKGKAAIIAKAGDRWAARAVFVWNPITGVENGHEWVDLGLPSGLKWATCNIGANTPEECGDYYSWGETDPNYSSQNPLTWKEGKSSGYDYASYKWCNGTYDSLTKYCTDSFHGTVDNKQVLDSEDDIAHVKLGGSWRIPTDVEWVELINYARAWTTQNGIAGRIAYGPKGISIFLPAAGNWNGTNFFPANYYGYYWTSSLCRSDPHCAWSIVFNHNDIGIKGGQRGVGYSVRAVTK